MNALIIPSVKTVSNGIYNPQGPNIAVSTVYSLAVPSRPLSLSPIETNGSTFPPSGYFSALRVRASPK